jgi:hypothetical protein
LRDLAQHLTAFRLHAAAFVELRPTFPTIVDDVALFHKHDAGNVGKYVGNPNTRVIGQRRELGLHRWHGGQVCFQPLTKGLVFVVHFECKVDANVAMPVEAHLGYKEQIVVAALGNDSSHDQASAHREWLYADFQSIPINLVHNSARKACHFFLAMWSVFVTSSALQCGILFGVATSVSMAMLYERWLDTRQASARDQRRIMDIFIHTLTKHVIIYATTGIIGAGLYVDCWLHYQCAWPAMWVRDFTSLALGGSVVCLPTLCRLIKDPTQRAILGSATTLVCCLFGIPIMAPTLIRLAWACAHNHAILHILLSLTTVSWQHETADNDALD